jgi:hypothetical protein
MGDAPATIRGTGDNDFDCETTCGVIFEIHTTCVVKANAITPKMMSTEILRGEGNTWVWRGVWPAPETKMPLSF